MKYPKKAILFSFLICLTHLCFSIGQNTYVKTNYNSGDFKLFYNGKTASLYVDSKDHPGVIRAVNDLQTDIKAVTGKKPFISNTASSLSSHSIIIGSIRKNPIIKKLIKSGKLDVTGVKKEWEAFVIQVVPNPVEGVKEALVIAGNDKRGTIFGIYDLSEQMGVSPWHWWADVTPQRKSSIIIAKGSYKQKPSVKYRGIFLNDEAPCLTSWVGSKFGSFNKEFYSKVFELLLRLKANYIWPAMWKPRAFYEDDEQNGALAHKYGIVMGTSHHEPMARAHEEWKNLGEWNYAKNKSKLYDFWDEGVKRSAQWDTLYTVGMRGDGDKGMAGDNLGANVKLLEKIISDQRKILDKRIISNIKKIPQAWWIYKEVLDYYNYGITIPDDITFGWCDDNHGFIRRVPTPEEQKRSGGAGIYYHFDYVGAPRSYKWINVTPLPKIWQQMSLAYDNMARRAWIVNVGDLKPMEFSIDFFMTLAWNPSIWTRDNLFTDYAVQWAEREFGSAHAKDIATIVSSYLKYNDRRKPSQITQETFSITHFQEAERVTAQWDKLASMAEAIKPKLAPDLQDAFHQLVLYPAKASGNITKMYIAQARSALYQTQGRASTNYWANEVNRLFEEDTKMAVYYNETMSDGKWNHLMDQAHIGQKGWRAPEKNKKPEIATTALSSGSEMGVALEGTTAYFTSGSCTLPKFSKYNQETRWIDVFNRNTDSFEYTVTPSADWIIVSGADGQIQTEDRLVVSIDWKKVPTGNNIQGWVNISGAGKTVNVSVPVFNPAKPALSEVKGAIVSNGYASIEAAHYSRNVDKKGVGWREIKGIGRTLSGMSVFPTTTASINQTSEAPYLEYQVYFFEPGTYNIRTYCSPNVNVIPDHGLRYKLSVDGENITEFDIFPKKTKTHWSNSSWSNGVMNNIQIKNTSVKIANKGYHRIRIHMVDINLVFQKMVISSEELGKTYLGPPESFNTASGLPKQWVTAQTISKEEPLLIAEAKVKPKQIVYSSQLRIEAEGASKQEAFFPFAVKKNNYASGGRYIVWPADGTEQNNASPSEDAPGQASYTFYLSEPTDVKFQIRINFPNADDDSFHYRLDDKDWVTQNNIATSSWETIDLTTYENLQAGKHTLTLQRREDGAQMDSLILSTLKGKATVNKG